MQYLALYLSLVSYYLFLIEVCLIYSGVLVSGVLHWDSVIHK